ncbi:MAG: FmdE family protein, partial [Bacteroidales bacterium]
FIALGSLRTYADFFTTYPQFIDKVDKIVWYNDTSVTEGFNYACDTAAYALISALDIPLYVVSNTREDLTCAQSYIDSLQHINSPYARNVYSQMTSAIVKQKMHTHTLGFWDDLVPLFVTNPILFETENITSSVYAVYPLQSIPLSVIYETAYSVYSSGAQPETHMFSQFPVQSSLYIPELRPVVDSIITEFGFTEWKSIVLTNEIHGHIGIYSIIGAKMGVRACEFFNVGVNNLKIVSYAGSRPPLSCFNDGIQISTGATIGQGLISVSDTVKNVPQIVCECNGKKILISVKPEIARNMKSDIATGVSQYGLLTDEYWTYIEKLAFSYWTEMSRHSIFNIEIIH